MKHNTRFLVSKTLPGICFSLLLALFASTPASKGGDNAADPLYDLQNKLMHEINQSQKANKISDKDARYLLKRQANISRRKAELREKHRGQLSAEEQQDLTEEIQRVRESLLKLQEKDASRKAAKEEKEAKEKEAKEKEAKKSTEAKETTPKPAKKKPTRESKH